MKNYYDIYQAGGRTGASYGRRNAPDPPDPDPTFWDHVQDVGEFGLNMVATPFETITGVNFYDPEFESDFMQNTSDIGSAVLSTGTDLAGNIFAPGLYGEAKKGASSLGQGLGLKDATHGEHTSFGSKMAGTIEAVGSGVPLYGAGVGQNVQTGGNVRRYQTQGTVSGSPIGGQFQGMSPAFMQNAPQQMMPYLQNMFSPQGMGGGQIFGQMSQMGQMGQQSGFGSQEGSWQNYMGNLGQSSPDPLDKMGVGPMAMTGKAANLGLNIANIWSGATKTQSEMVKEAEQALEVSQRNARIKAAYNPTQMKTNLLNPEFLASYKTGLKEDNTGPPGTGISLVERGGRIGEHMRKYQTKGETNINLESGKDYGDYTVDQLKKMRLALLGIERAKILRWNDDEVTKFIKSYKDEETEKYARDFVKNPSKVNEVQEIFSSIMDKQGKWGLDPLAHAGQQFKSTALTLTDAILGTKFQNKGNVGLPKYQWEGLISGLASSGGGGGGMDWMSMLGNLGGSLGGGNKGGDKGGDSGKKEGLLAPEGKFRRGIRDMIGSYFLGPMGPQVNKMIQSTGFEHPIQRGGMIPGCLECGGNIKAQTGGGPSEPVITEKWFTPNVEVVRNPMDTTTTTTTEGQRTTVIPGQTYKDVNVDPAEGEAYWKANPEKYKEYLASKSTTEPLSKTDVQVAPYTPPQRELKSRYEIAPVEVRGNTHTTLNIDGEKVLKKNEEMADWYASQGYTRHPITGTYIRQSTTGEGKIYDPSMWESAHGSQMSTKPDFDYSSVDYGNVGFQPFQTAAERDEWNSYQEALKKQKRKEKHDTAQSGGYTSGSGYYSGPDVYGGGLNEQEQFFANLGQGLGQQAGPAGAATSQLATGLYKGISDFNKPKIIGSGGLRPYMESNFAGYSPNNAAILSNLGTKHKHFQKYAYHLNRLSPENTDILEANRAVTARSQMQGGGMYNQMQQYQQGGQTLPTDWQSQIYKGQTLPDDAVNPKLQRIDYKKEEMSQLEDQLESAKKRYYELDERIPINSNRDAVEKARIEFLNLEQLIAEKKQQRLQNKISGGSSRVPLGSEEMQSGGSTEAVGIEVEGGETINTIDGENNKFMGPSHDQGGINIDANEGDFVYPKGIWAKRHTKRTKREADILSQLEAAGINTEELT